SDGPPSSLRARTRPSSFRCTVIFRRALATGLLLAFGSCHGPSAPLSSKAYAAPASAGARGRALELEPARYEDAEEVCDRLRGSKTCAHPGQGSDGHASVEAAK